MEDVKRYSFRLGGVYQEDDGYWIAHEDYATLHSELERVKAELKTAKDLVDHRTGEGLELMDELEKAVKLVSNLKEKHYDSIDDSDFTEINDFINSNTTFLNEGKK